MELPKDALEELEKLRALSNRKLKKERRQVEALLAKLKDKRLLTYKATNNLLFLIDKVQKERKK